MHRLTVFLGMAAAGAGVFAATPRLELSLTEAGALRQRVLFGDEELIASSPLGIVLDGVALGECEAEVSRKTVDDLITLTLRNATGRVWTVEARTFPDGVAVRYRIPSDAPVTVTRENTTFTFPSGTTAWYASAVFQYGYTQRYQERKTDDIEGEILAPPATFRNGSALDVGGSRHTSAVTVRPFTSIVCVISCSARNNANVSSGVFPPNVRKTSPKTSKAKMPAAARKPSNNAFFTYRLRNAFMATV